MLGDPLEVGRSRRGPGHWLSEEEKKAIAESPDTAPGRLSLPLPCFLRPTDLPVTQEHI